MVVDYFVGCFGSGLVDVFFDVDYYCCVYFDFYFVVLGRLYVCVDGVFGDFGIDWCVDFGVGCGVVVLLLVVVE